MNKQTPQLEKIEQDYIEYLKYEEPYFCPICRQNDSTRSRLGAVEMCQACRDDPAEVIWMLNNNRNVLENRIKELQK